MQRLIKTYCNICCNYKLQLTATHCSKLLCFCRRRNGHFATHCNTQQHSATHCNIYCNKGQVTATHCNTLQHTATHCNTLQHTATHRNTLKYTAIHYNTLQHTAAHCNTLLFFAADTISLATHNYVPILFYFSRKKNGDSGWRERPKSGGVLM